MDSALYTTINIPINNVEYIYSAFSHFLISRIRGVVVDPAFKVLNAVDLGIKIFQSDTIRHHEEFNLHLDMNKYSISYQIDLFEGELVFSHNDIIISMCTMYNTIQTDTIIAVKDARGLFYQFGIIKLRILHEQINKFDYVLKLAFSEFDKYLKERDIDKKYITIFSPEHSYWDNSQKISKRTLDSIYLPLVDKMCIIEDMRKFMMSETRDIYARLGITYKRVYLFEGIPGAGKTSFIKALASEFEYNIACMTFHSKLEDAQFIKLVSNLPDKTILLLEDMDCLFKSRKEHDTESNSVTLSGILNALDGICTKHGLVCFITTNYKSHLDQALIRPGRVDKILKFDYMVQEQIEQAYRAFMWETYTEDAFTAFYKVLSTIHIKLSVSLITQYLFNYYNNPTGAFENIGNIKDYYHDSKIEKTADDTDMYS